VRMTVSRECRKKKRRNVTSAPFLDGTPAIWVRRRLQGTCRRSARKEKSGNS
jgi:hypothetical protein